MAKKQPDDAWSVTGLLVQMRNEQREDHQKLVEKVDTGFKSVAEAMAGHDLEDTQRFGRIGERLTVVENTRKTIRWMAATIVAAAIAGVFDFVFVHLPRILAAKP